MPQPDTSIYQFYIALVDSEPPIWRCFHTPVGLNLAELHEVIRIVMGWPQDAPYTFKLADQHLS
ncbi:plasmid pRiA4b ORF-3 family protein, partial [Haemophilus parainfluenzae]|uniref:plasmid pRiA4b ORF-3 family protein n=1 Tax=Haemophilus parainfluenzae TaxID=729 RepID=UPI00124B6B8C